MSRPFAPVDLGERLRACGSSRERVRVTMAAFGGYWRPLAAVARLLEELGELSEELGELSEELRPAGDAPRTSARPDERLGAKLGAELADLWIITTALADQFLGEVAEPGSRSPRSAHESSAEALVEAPAPARTTTPAPAADAGLELLAAAGPIARIVNYYDGPKVPRSLDGWISLETAVARFHDALATVALASDVDLHAAVQAKLEAIPKLDSGRFSATWHDPATAPCLDDFRRLPSVADGSLGTARDGPLSTARLWGGPEWRPGSIAANVEAIVPSLTTFTRAAPIERIDAYVIPGPPLPSTAAREQWLDDLLAEISARDLDLDAKVVAGDDGARAFACLGTPVC